MRVTTRLRLIASGLAAVLAAAGCGTTVRDRSGALRSADGTVADDGLGGSVQAGGSGGFAAGGNAATGGAGGGLSAPGASIAGGGTAPGGARSGAGALTSGPGVTATEVYVGFIHDVNAGAVNSAAGVGAITSGDDQANGRAVIDDINKHGGVGGRKLVPVYADFDETSSQTFDQQYAAACQKFTQDNPRVFAVDGAGLPDSYRQCISKAGVTMVSSSLPTVGQAQLSRYPAFIEQGYPNVDRLAAFEVTALADQHYFTPWNAVTGQSAATGAVKVGVLTYNDTVFSSAVDRYLVPALKRLGYDPQVAKVSQVTTASDYGAQGAAVKSAQLSFAANNVTHVIMFESNGGLGTLFFPTARAQGYYPRYGGNTASAFEALLEAKAADTSQLNGAVAFGWVPAIDLPARLNPPDAPWSNANRRHCLDVMKANGISFTSGNAEGIALNTCSDLYLLKLALDKTPSLITRSTVIHAIESLGTAYQRAGGVGEEFRPGRHDPSDKAYNWRYFDDCTCFRYDGPPITIP